VLFHGAASLQTPHHRAASSPNGYFLPMIVAVTGANGFIGRHLCAALRQSGHTARAVTRRDFEAHALDTAFAGADTVVHAAAATRAPSRALLWKSNVELTERTIDAARRAGVRRFVLVSSQAAAGPASSRERPVLESDPPRPVEEYGRSKLAAEELTRASGLPFVIVRPAAVYGSDDRDFAVLFRLARRGALVHPGNRSHWISIIHVDDCAAGIVEAASNPRALGDTFFLANESAVSWGDLGRASARAFQKRPVIDLEIPYGLVNIGARLGDVLSRATGKASLLTTEKVALAEHPYWVCSGSRAASVLGFVPRLSLQQGLDAVARHLRSS
jgi:nucleoside-diphosphate-sugar epimerase